MPQLQNLVLTDRATPTPVDHTLTPREITDNVGVVAESSGIPDGDTRVTISMKRSSTNRYKGVLKLSVPVVAIQTVNGVDSPVVVRTAYAEVDVNFAGTSSEAERNDVVGMLASALSSSKTLVNDAFVKLQGIY